jgi:hypothetical protein
MSQKLQIVRIKIAIYLALKRSKIVSTFISYITMNTWATSQLTKGNVRRDLKLNLVKEGVKRDNVSSDTAASGRKPRDGWLN